MAETLGNLNLGPEGALSFLESEQKLGEKAKGERQKAAEAQILAQEGAYSKPAPDFQPSQESASGFAALGALLAASGAILGSGGRSSGIMAMNAVAGMMNGYNAGRKDLYEQQRQQFEESMKSWEKHRAEVKDAFDRAMKIAPYNLTLAQQSLNRDLVSLGLKPLAEVNQKSGPIAAASAYYNAHENTSGQLAKIMPSLTGGLSGDQKQFFDTLKTTDEKLAYLKAVAADKAAKSAAQKEELDIQAKQLGIQKTEGEIAAQKATAERGGLTVEQQQEKERRKANADFIVKNNMIPTTESQIKDVGEFYPDYKPVSKQYGEMAIFERSVPGSSAAFKSEAEKKDANASLQSVGTAAKVLKDSQNPNIKFGEVPALWENIKQRVRANLEGMGFKDDGNSTYYTQLPNGQRLGDFIQSQISQTPVDPNDQNAVFQKEAAFSNFDIERASRGGSVLPVGFLKVAGPFLNPKQYTKEAFSGVYADRVAELDRKLASFGFDSSERNKIYSTYGDVIGYPILKIEGVGKKLPAGVPEGSTIIGTTPDGTKNVYKSPDGKQYAVPKEAQ